MPTLEDKVYNLDTRVSLVEKEMSNVNLTQIHINETMVAHMESEERDRKEMKGHIADIIKYKWILFGGMVVLWLSSGNNEFLKLIKLMF